MHNHMIGDIVDPEIVLVLLSVTHGGNGIYNIFLRLLPGHDSLCFKGMVIPGYVKNDPGHVLKGFFPLVQQRVVNTWQVDAKDGCRKQQNGKDNGQRCFDP